MDVKEGERVWISVSAVVRITLQDGCYHEDVGHGHCENMKGRAAAIEKVRKRSNLHADMQAQKEAVTDATKRALKTFGNVLGLCIYDKEFNNQISKIKAGPPVSVKLMIALTDSRKSRSRISTVVQSSNNSPGYRSRLLHGRPLFPLTFRASRKRRRRLLLAECPQRQPSLAPILRR